MMEGSIQEDIPRASDLFYNAGRPIPLTDLLSMKTVADLQQAIIRLHEARLVQDNSNGSKQRIQQKSLVLEVMEYLQAELDSTTHTKSNNCHPFFGTAGVYYKKCLRTLRQLSITYKVLPTSLVICNVKSDGRPAVGGGGFSDIYRGTIGEESVCIKVLRLAMEQDEEIRDNIRKEFCKEALIWRQLKHPNILPLLGVNAELFSPSFCLISPWMENKDIITFLRKNPSHDRQNVLSEVAAGLCYLHSRDPPILHGDIRGANILVSDNFHCCLADFGLTVIVSDSRTFTNATTSAMTKGTTRWMAPELISSSTDPAEINTSRDIYAFGCTVLEILTLQLPFHDKRTDPAVILSLIQGERPARPQNVWYPDPIWDLTTQCWAQEPTDRPNAQEILQTLHGSDASYGDAGSTAPRREYEPGPDWSQTPMFIQGLLDLPPPPNPTIQVQGPTINLTDLTEQTDYFRITTRNQEMQKHQTQTQTVVEPLDKQRFGVTYKHWCLTQNIVHDPRLLIIDTGPIDLFQLHCYVMREGGIQSVTRKELWPVIAWRLGADRLPGGANEQPKSGPGAAFHIEIVYRNYLSAFDTVYMASVMDSRRKAPSNLGPDVPAPPLNPNIIAPLDKLRFETSYKQWCLTKNIVHDPWLLAIDCRPIDLFRLHCRVMLEGGVQNVTRKELWPVIGGYLGMIDFPGTANELPKSGPAAAVHIQHVYKEYLSAFDAAYMTSVLDSRRKMSQPEAALSFPEIVRGFNPSQLWMVFTCADKTAAELRARGMSESMIRFIENHRASLQGKVVEQENFCNDLRRYIVLVIAKMPPVEVPSAIRAEYSSLLELVFRLANYLDNSLPVFSIVSQDEENTKKLLSAIVTVQCQRTLLASPNPIFIVSFEALQKYHNQLQNARRQIYSVNQTTIEGEHPSGPPGDKQPDGHIPPGPSHVLHSFPPSQPLKPPLSNNTNHKGVVSTPKYFAEISPSSWNTAGVKRSREEELGPSAGSSSNLVPPVVNKPSPPKRRRTGNWEVPIGQSLQKNQAVENIKRYIESAGPSTFVDPVMSTTFPLVEKSDKNVPVLDAWRSITRDPRYKECDIANPCSEFASRACSDGSKVVLEPSGISSLMETLTSKT